MRIDKKFGGSPVDRPRQLFDVKGLGAFVALDYSTGVGARFEHSVLFLPNTWESLYEVIRAPGLFMEHVCRSYTSVKDYANNAVNTFPFAAPVTIKIEPLTAPSPDNLAILSALSGLFPGFKNCVLNIMNGSITLPEFRNLVIKAARNPAHSPLDPFPGRPASYWTDRLGPDIDPEMFNLTTIAPPRELFYVAEFALHTRVLTIRYIPRSRPSNTQNATIQPKWFFRRTTNVTINPVKYLASTFVHFDIAFDGPRSHEEIAQARAELAMDYLENPNILSHIIGQHSTGLDYYWMNDSLTNTGQALIQKSVAGNTTKPVFKFPDTLDPVALIDSVLPDPERLPSNGGFEVQPTDPVPSPCVVIIYDEETGTYYIIIKNYTG